MKFRYKVLFTNLILLSLGLGLVGYLMIHKNFELAKQTQLKNAIVQNNLVQSSVEYELLQLLNSVSDNSETSNNNTDNNNAEKSSISASSIAAQLPQIGSRVSSSVRSRDSYCSDNNISEGPIFVEIKKDELLQMELYGKA